jgi:hypothetical protein
LPGVSAAKGRSKRRGTQIAPSIRDYSRFRRLKVVDKYTLDFRNTLDLHLGRVLR